MQIVANGLSNIGTINSYRGNYDLALESYQRALDIFLKGDDDKALSATYNNIGSAHQYKGEYQTAFEFYDKSLAQLNNREDSKSSRFSSTICCHNADT